MKKSKLLCLVLACLTVLSLLLPGCAKNGTAKIVIWTSGEDYRNEYYLSELEKKFPDYTINLEYMNTSTIAAKVIEEGENCTCDIILSEEYGYLKKCEPYLAELTDFDFSSFLPELVPESRKFTPCRNWCRKVASLRRSLKMAGASSSTRRYLRKRICPRQRPIRICSTRLSRD